MGHNRLLNLSVACIAAALVAACSASMEEQYTTEMFLEEPDSAGFAAIRELHPDIWREFEHDLEERRLTSRHRVQVAAARFLGTKLPQFLTEASDEAVVGFDRTYTEKLGYLSLNSPAACLRSAIGERPENDVATLNEERHLADARALEQLVKSGGGDNSGLASEADAERLYLSGLLNFARSHPEGYLAYKRAAEGERPHATPELACAGYIGFRELLLKRPATEYARYRRLEAATGAAPVFSDAARREFALVYLHAAAEVIRRGLPQQTDEITTMTDVGFDGRTFSYHYAVSQPVDDAVSFRAEMAAYLMDEVCRDDETLAVVEAGGAFGFIYTDVTGRRLEMEIDGSDCG